jgi:hypothetical protein
MMDRILPRNVGTLDRMLRVAAGIALLSLVFVGPRTAWGLLGIVPLATALLGSCPAYTLFGVRTCPMSAARR